MLHHTLNMKLALPFLLFHRQTEAGGNQVRTKTRFLTISPFCIWKRNVTALHVSLKIVQALLCLNVLPLRTWHLKCQPFCDTSLIYHYSILNNVQKGFSVHNVLKMCVATHNATSADVKDAFSPLSTLWCSIHTAAIPVNGVMQNKIHYGHFTTHAAIAYGWLNPWQRRDFGTVSRTSPNVRNISNYIRVTIWYSIC